MKYIARISEVLQSGMHRTAAIVDGELVPVGTLPTPHRVEIIVDPGEVSCFMYRFTKAGEVCGDTWHASFDDAVAQASFEFGLKRDDFVRVVEGGKS